MTTKDYKAALVARYRGRVYVPAAEQPKGLFKDKVMHDVTPGPFASLEARLGVTGQSFKPGPPTEADTATPMDIKKVDRVIVHHTAGNRNASAAAIDRYHRLPVSASKKSKPKSAIAYHYLIKYDGTIERGRSTHWFGDHAGQRDNLRSIAVVFAGNFMNYPPSEAQIASGAKLIAGIKSQLGISRVQGHGEPEGYKTLCPGKNMNMDALRRRIDQYQGSSAIAGESCPTCGGPVWVDGIHVN